MRATISESRQAGSRMLAQERRQWMLIKTVFAKFVDDNVPQLGASLSYYTVFSLPPLKSFIRNLLASFTPIRATLKRRRLYFYIIP